MNFHMFGDVVAFDTTYSTNKYCMIFAPFTGKDNHGSPVTFVAGLLSGEDAESFSWLFQKFIECMGSAPKLIITDQELGMKVAIERVLVGTRHRWCMWHIMLKLADKISKELQSNEDFKKELNHYVWSELIEPKSFERGWPGIIEKYGLMNDWFTFMYEARSYWVPAYFRDFSMSGLLRTTSILESENSFYKRYTNPRNNLMEFWININHALDDQRHSFSHLNYLDSTVIPTLETRWPYEKEVDMLYSGRMFLVVKEEIVYACNKCVLIDIKTKDGGVDYGVKDEFGNSYIVVYSEEDESFDCGCKLFLRKGILCRHIFIVFKNREMKSIPAKYILGRWRKFSDVLAVHGVCSSRLESCGDADEMIYLKNKIMAQMFGYMQVIEGNVGLLTGFLARVIDVGQCITGESNVEAINDKRKAFESFYGSSVPQEIHVHPPDVVKTKGSGSRLVSRKEKAIKMASNPKRRCGKCKELTNHDSRNCHKFQSNLKE